jgi:hypothetical protein
MSDIYWLPERVVIWLGEDKGQAAEAVRLINQIAMVICSENEMPSGDFSSVVKLAYCLTVTEHVHTAASTDTMQSSPPLRQHLVNPRWMPIEWLSIFRGSTGS